MATPVNALYVRFINKIPGSEDQIYTANFQVNSVGTITVPSGGDYAEVGLVPKTGQDFIGIAYIKNAAGIDMTSATMFFRYDIRNVKVITSSVNAPDGVTFEDKGNNKFDLTISAV